MSYTNSKNYRLFKEKFETWWQNEGKELMTSPMTSPDMPVNIKYIAWVAYSNGAYVSQSNNLELENV